MSGSGTRAGRRRRYGSGVRGRLVACLLTAGILALGTGTVLAVRAGASGAADATFPGLPGSADRYVPREPPPPPGRPVPPEPSGPPRQPASPEPRASPQPPVSPAGPEAPETPDGPGRLEDRGEGPPAGLQNQSLRRDGLRHEGARDRGDPDPEALERAVRRARRMSPLTSLLVSHGGELLVEEYYRGMGPDQPVNLKSVSKTLLSPLVGIAIRDGLLEGVEQPVEELLPGYFRGLEDPRKRRITLHDLLSMTAGLETTSFRNYGEWVTSRDWVRDALDRPLICPPGRCWEYSTGNTHLIAAILARAAGKSLLVYAREVLFGPLGVRIGAWDRDPQGRYLGGNNMALRPRDLLTFGLLHLSGGEWRGRQLVPVEWIVASWRRNATSPWNGHGYGYLWWIEEWGGERAYFAWGYGGQYLVLVPRLRLAVVATSSLADRGRSHVRDMRRFFDRYLIPAFRTGGRATPGVPGVPGAEGPGAVP